jgi:hypothetical protein
MSREVHVRICGGPGLRCPGRPGLALRHQITVLERQLHGQRVRFTWAAWAWPASVYRQAHVAQHLPRRRAHPPCARPVVTKYLIAN